MNKIRNFLPEQYDMDQLCSIKHNYLSEQFSDYKNIFEKIENVVLNVLDDGFFSDPVEEIYTSHLSDYVEHSKRTEKRIEELYYQ